MNYTKGKGNFVLSTTWLIMKYLGRRVLVFEANHSEFLKKKKGFEGKNLNFIFQK